MNQANIDYLEHARQEIATRSGPDPLTDAIATRRSDSQDARAAIFEEEATFRQNLCSQLRQYAARSPDGGGFTSAAGALNTSASSVCDSIDYFKTKAAQERKKLESARAQTEAAREQAEKQQRGKAIMAIGRQCAAKFQTIPCTIDGITDEERADCENGCKRLVTAALNDLAATGVSTCVSKYVEGKGKKPASCDVMGNTPAGVTLTTDQVAQANLTCLQLCTTRVKENEAFANSAEGTSQRESLKRGVLPGGDRSATGGGGTAADCIQRCGKVFEECRKRCRGDLRCESACGDQSRNCGSRCN